MATKQSCLAAAELSEYLLQNEEFKNVLLGQFQLDPIEKRFGRYRQLSGGNYYISVRQILESKKKIRIQCLVKFNRLSIGEIDKIMTEEDYKVAEVILTSWVACESLAEVEEAS